MPNDPRRRPGPTGVVTAAVAALLAGLLLCGPARAVQVADVQLPDRVALADGQSLALNGAGVRRKFFIKVYVGALYLARPAADLQAVLAQPGPRRVLMHVLYDEIDRAKLVGAWNDGFANNLDAATLAALQARIARFNTLFDTVHRGDEVLLDYLPGQGTVVTVRGERRGVIPGRDFNDALMHVWLGADPADSGLKAAMLGAD